MAMKQVQKISVHLSLLMALSVTSIDVFANDVPVSRSQIEVFLRKHQSSLLAEYRCDHNASRQDCKVVCSSDSLKLVDTSHVRRAYYAERRDRVSSKVIGFVLVVDTDDRVDKNIWAILQTSSSCYFEGLSPNT